MAHTTCLVFLVSTVSGCRKNAVGRGSVSSRHITKLEQSIFYYISVVAMPKVAKVSTAYSHNNAYFAVVFASVNEP
jgi:hypothetical protein